MAWPWLKTMVQQFRPKYRQAVALGSCLDLHRSGDFAGACKALRVAMKHGSPWASDGDLYVARAQCEFWATGDVRKAFAFLDKARELGCSEAYHESIKGEVLWESGDLPGGLKAFEKSVAAEPSAHYLTNLAWAFSYLEDERARDTWQRVLEAEPRDCMAHAYLGHELLRCGARDEAVAMAREADRLAQTGRDFVHVAWLYHDLGEFEAAIEKYGDAERQGYQNTAAICAAVADCQLSLGDENAAREYLSRAEECGSTNDYVREVSERIRGSR